MIITTPCVVSSIHRTTLIAKFAVHILVHSKVQLTEYSRAVMYPQTALISKVSYGRRRPLARLVSRGRRVTHVLTSQAAQTVAHGGWNIGISFR